MRSDGGLEHSRPTSSLLMHASGAGKRSLCYAATPGDKDNSFSVPPAMAALGWQSANLQRDKAAGVTTECRR